MPGFDGTGPRGAGPMTGRGRGYCNPGARAYGAYGRGGRRQAGLGYGRGGGGFGRGFGRGRGGWGSPPEVYGPPSGYEYDRSYEPNPEDEMDMLKQEAAALKEEMEAINRRIRELGSESA